jgi:hypothetical protein
MFPISLIKKHHGLYVQCTQYVDEMLLYPFLTDYFLKTEIWDGVYDRDGLLPQFNINRVREVPISQWLDESSALIEFAVSQKSFGFILHTSRCGSTLFSEALKCFKGVTVLSEPPIINAILDPRLRLLPEFRAELLLRAVEVMGTYARAEFLVIKTRSWNSLQSATLAQSFSCCKGVFIHRDSREVFQSISRKPPGWIRAFHVFRDFFSTEPDILSSMELMTCEAIRQFCLSIHGFPNGQLLALNYNRMFTVFFDFVNDLWGLNPSDLEVAKILENFTYYSKSLPHAKSKFIPTEIGESGIQYPNKHIFLDDLRDVITYQLISNSSRPHALFPSWNPAPFPLPVD